MLLDAHFSITSSVAFLIDIVWGPDKPASLEQMAACIIAYYFPNFNFIYLSFRISCPYGLRFDHIHPLKLLPGSFMCPLLTSHPLLFCFWFFFLYNSLSPNVGMLSVCMETHLLEHSLGQDTNTEILTLSPPSASNLQEFSARNEVPCNTLPSTLGSLLACSYIDHVSVATTTAGFLLICITAT